MNSTFVPIGAVLVIEQRHCKGCGETYTVPAHKLAQLYCAPHDPNQHSIEPSDAIRGSKRTTYRHETTCERCPQCFKTTLHWDQVADLKIVIPHLPADIAPYEDYAVACSARDKIRNDLNAALIAHEREGKRIDTLTSNYKQACLHAKALARAKMPEQPAYRYSTTPTKMRDIFKQKPEAKVIVPASDDEI